MAKGIIQLLSDEEYWKTSKSAKGRADEFCLNNYFQEQLRLSTKVMC